MADMKTRLATYLPGMTDDELDAWLLEAATQHGYTSLTDIPNTRANMIIHYARYVALQAKAAETAENAALNIKGIGVNKSGASGNYNQLIKQAFADYRRHGGRLGNAAVHSALTRADGR